MIKNLKRMTSITAGAMSSRQDFHTLKILGSLDNVKSVKKIDQFLSWKENLIFFTKHNFS